MKYLDEYRNKDLVLELAGMIRREAADNYNFMEVCGGHTAAIHRFGIPSLLPPGVNLISGPGCPVCVTGIDFINKAIELARKPGMIITTFGDMIRVPGSSSSLEKEAASGADVRVVISCSDGLEIAKSNPGKTVVFLAAGFETTAPGTAATIKRAAKERISNFCILTAHKIMPPALEALLSGETKINGLICPGHVATITGSKIFEFIPAKHSVGCVVAGFEPADLLLSILMLIRQVNRKRPEVEIQYRRAVTTEGNLVAQKYMAEVFEKADVDWRGFGVIPGSGLKPVMEYAMYDVESVMKLDNTASEENRHCICGLVLRGLKKPPDCRLFGNGCIPENPAGACMVSVEGTCHTWYRYNVAI